MLGLDLHASCVDGVVGASQDAELAGGVQFGDVIGLQNGRIDQRGLDDQCPAFGQTDGDRSERRVPLRGIRTVEAAQGDVRQGLRHAVSAPHGVGKVAQGFGQRGVDGTAPDDEMFHLSEQCPFAGHLQAVVDLHRYHGCEDGRILQPGQRMAAGLHCDEPQSSHQRTHDDHLSGDVLQGHAQQGRVARVQVQKVASQACACFHACFLYFHAFGRAGRTGSLHRHGRTVAVPFGQERTERIVYVGIVHRLNHSFSPFIASGLSMLSVKSSPVPSP